MASKVWMQSLIHSQISTTTPYHLTPCAGCNYSFMRRFKLIYVNHVNKRGPVVVWRNIFIITIINTKSREGEREAEIRAVGYLYSYVAPLVVVYGGSSSWFWSDMTLHSLYSTETAYGKRDTMQLVYGWKKNTGNIDCRTNCCFSHKSFHLSTL